MANLFGPVSGKNGLAALWHIVEIPEQRNHAIIAFAEAGRGGVQCGVKNVVVRMVVLLLVVMHHLERIRVRLNVLERNARDGGDAGVDVAHKLTAVVALAIEPGLIRVARLDLDALALLEAARLVQQRLGGVDDALGLAVGDELLNEKEAWSQTQCLESDRRAVRQRDARHDNFATDPFAGPKEVIAGRDHKEHVRLLHKVEILQHHTIASVNANAIGVRRQSASRRRLDLRINWRADLGGRSPRSRSGPLGAIDGNVTQFDTGTRFEICKVFRHRVDRHRHVLGARRAGVVASVAIYDDVTKEFVFIVEKRRRFNNAAQWSLVRCVTRCQIAR